MDLPDICSDSESSIEYVKSRKEFFIRVRKLYRPHDTHLSHEEARSKPYSLLHWSEEIVRMYPREVAARNNKRKGGR